MMTIEQLTQLPLGKPFANGIISDSVFKLINPDFIGDSPIKQLKWIAKMGMGWHDWAIYYGPNDFPDELIIEHGFKVRTTPAIRELVPCEIAVLDKYRY